VSISKPPGNSCLKAKFVNETAALFLMVNVKDPEAVVEFCPDGSCTTLGLGLKAMIKVGAGTVTVKLVAAAVALSPWLLLRFTAGLVRTPAVVAVT
jgi:hypothetical protein